MNHRTPLYAALVSAAVVVIAVMNAGCAAATMTRRGPLLPVLTARQRGYAAEGATAAEWDTLAQAFDSLATAGDASAADAERARFGAAVSRVHRGAPSATELAAFVSMYPSSVWADDALRLLADEHARAGHDGSYRQALRAIVNDHPGSPHAADAWAALWSVGAAPGPSVLAATPPRAADVVRIPPRTAPASAPTIVQELGLGIRTVMLDAGHGGTDPGATVAGRPHEKEIALDMAMLVGDELRAAGLTVLMTRDADVFVPLGARNAMAAAQGADLFVSLHVNHFEDPAAQGAETWIAAPARDERSALVAARENLGAGSTSELADYVSRLLSETKTEESRALAAAIQEELVGATGATDRGVKEAGFVVLLGLRVPSALVEMGFLTNAAEAARLADVGYRARMADGIASGIVRYVRSRSYIP